MKHSSRRPKGQIMVILAVVLPTLLGAMALCADVAVFYFNWANLQKAADSAALAGAHYLPNDTARATSVATTYAIFNAVAAGEITSITYAANNTEITVTLTRSVPYYFAKVLGLSDAPVSVAATAAIAAAIEADRPIPVGLQRCSGGGSPYSCYEGLSNVTIAMKSVSGGSTGGTSGSGGGSGKGGGGKGGGSGKSGGSGKGGGGSSSTATAPGNWGLLDLGQQGGGQDVRTELAWGCDCSVPADGWVSVDTEPGAKIGPVSQGIADRIARADAQFPGDAPSSYSVGNPRLVTVPIVNFDGANGASQIPTYGFALMWLFNSNSNGDIRATFLRAVAEGTPGAGTNSLALVPRLIR